MGVMRNRQQFGLNSKLVLSLSFLQLRTILSGTCLEPRSLAIRPLSVALVIFFLSSSLSWRAAVAVVVPPPRCAGPCPRFNPPPPPPYPPVATAACSNPCGRQEDHECFSEQEIVTELFESKSVLCDVTHLKQNRYLASAGSPDFDGSPGPTRPEWDWDLGMLKRAAKLCWATATRP